MIANNNSITSNFSSQLPLSKYPFNVIQYRYALDNDVKLQNNDTSWPACVIIIYS